MAIIYKVTVGFVSQRFDTETRRFVSQEFIAEDGRQWENEFGEPLDMRSNEDLALIYGQGGVNEPNLNMEMVQPKVNAGVVMDATPLLAQPTAFEIGEQVLVVPSDRIVDLVRNEFMGTVVEIKGNLVSVKDAADDVFDVDPVQVHHVM
jgi:hypothetical protein